MKHTNHQKLSTILKSVFNDNTKKTYKDLANQLDQQGIALLLILFSLPAALPIPAPGYSTILSIPILMLASRLLLGYSTIWLPDGMEQKVCNYSDFKKTQKLIFKLVYFIEKFSKPRLLFFVDSPLFPKFIGIIIFICGLSMALPIPGTNTLPAGGIFLLSFSLLEKDGLLTIVATIYSIIAICVSTLIIILGYEVAKELLKIIGL